jgi:hypothetical protein
VKSCESCISRTTEGKKLGELWSSTFMKRDQFFACSVLLNFDLALSFWTIERGKRKCRSMQHGHRLFCKFAEKL